ncbi:MAG: M48 family metalloprotease [Burkholderiaceae bacterium]|nr:M48 family metalloprotease [Burkholderiaceae bacterium]
MRSRRLLALFVLALAGVVVVVDVSAFAAWRLLANGLAPPRFFLGTNTFVTLLIVLGGAWIETQRLRDGAPVLAERLGARAIDDADPLHHRLRDVAEEASIGAGVPVPALYVLDDPSINALAAGDSPAQAAVFVTRGALERLGRAELQGVVAHEIAHVVGGDSAANARLAGALYGLLSLHLFGARMLASAFGDSASAQRFFPLRIGLAVAGAIVFATGRLGLVAAHLLRAGISRQREYLADALAVQFTRDRDGLGSALRRIAGERPAALAAAYAPVVAHFLLVSPSIRGDLLSTHPPLRERIRRLYGRWMPPIPPAGADAGATPGESRTPGAIASALASTPGFVSSRRDAAAGHEAIPYVPVRIGRADVAHWLPAIGAAPGRGSFDDADADATSPAARLVERIRAASLRYDSAARWLEALVGGVLHESAVAPGEQAQDTELRAVLAWVLSPAGAALRVPLLELLLARVRRWSSAHRRELLDRCRRVVERDGRIDSSEWVYYTLARHRLLPASPAGPRARRANLPRTEHSRALAALFAMAAAIGEASARSTRDALADAAALLEVPPPAATPDEVGTAQLTRALDVLLGLPPLSKPILLKVLRGLARTPGDPNYEAFLRAVAAAIDCPAPRGVPTAQRPPAPSMRAACAPAPAVRPFGGTVLHETGEDVLIV